MLEEKAQSIKETVEEEVEMALHHKSKKRGGRIYGVGLSKTSAQERTPYHIVQRKGKLKQMGFPIKKLLMAPKKNNGKEKSS